MRMLFVVGVIALIIAAPQVAADGDPSPPPADPTTAPGSSGETPAAEHAAEAGPATEPDSATLSSENIGPDPGSSCRPMCMSGGAEG